MSDDRICAEKKYGIKQHDAWHRWLQSTRSARGVLTRECCQSSGAQVGHCGVGDTCLRARETDRPNSSGASRLFEPFSHRAEPEPSRLTPIDRLDCVTTPRRREGERKSSSSGRGCNMQIATCSITAPSTSQWYCIRLAGDESQHHQRPNDVEHEDGRKAAQ